MSLAGMTFSFLAIKPKVSLANGKLIACSCRLIQILWLLSYCKSVVADQAARKVTITTRFLWGIRLKKEIPFERIKAVGYGYKGAATSWSMWGETTDSIDTFKVMLVLRNPFERVPVFNFTGEGANFTGWRGVVLHGDEMVDYSGDQEETSRNYVMMLKEFIGVPLESVY